MFESKELKQETLTVRLGIPTVYGGEDVKDLTKIMNNRRCTVGKGCSTTCISKWKVCQVELMGSVSSSIDKLKEIKLGAPVEPTVKNAPAVIVDTPSTPKNKDEEFMGFLKGYDKLNKNPPKLDNLTTSEDFSKKLSSTEGLYNSNIKNYHAWIAFLLNPNVKDQSELEDTPQGSFFKKLRASLELGMGGKKQLNDATFNVENFTGESYKRIRNAQLGRGGTKTDKEEADSIERLLARRELLKPPVEKFRGVSVSSETLNNMVASAKANENYSGRALSSWSTDLRVGKNFSDIETGRPERVIYRAINKYGVPVGSLSQISNESEIITPGNANYRYLGYRPIRVMDKENGEENVYHVFDVEEF